MKYFNTFIFASFVILILMAIIEDFLMCHRLEKDKKIPHLVKNREENFYKLFFQNNYVRIIAFVLGVIAVINNALNTLK